MRGVGITKYLNWWRFNLIISAKSWDILIIEIQGNSFFTTQSFSLFHVHNYHAVMGTGGSHSEKNSLFPHIFISWLCLIISFFYKIKKLPWCRDMGRQKWPVLRDFMQKVLKNEQKNALKISPLTTFFATNRSRCPHLWFCSHIL